MQGLPALLEVPTHTPRSTEPGDLLTRAGLSAHGLSCVCVCTASGGKLLTVAFVPPTDKIYFW